MATPMTALIEAAQAHPQGAGSLELKARKRVAKFYFDAGLLYSVTINDVAPPFLQRLGWSLDENIDEDGVRSIAQRVPPHALKFELLKNQVITESLAAAISREFFLSISEEVLSEWGDVKTSWKDGDSLGPDEGFTVSLVEVERLKNMLARRESDILSFSEHLGVESSQIYNIVIHPGTKEVVPERDSQFMVLTESRNNLPFGQLIQNSGLMGAATVAKAVYILWQGEGITLSINGREISPYAAPQPEAVEPAPAASSQPVDEDDSGYDLVPSFTAQPVVSDIHVADVDEDDESLPLTDDYAHAESVPVPVLELDDDVDALEVHEVEQSRGVATTSETVSEQVAQLGDAAPMYEAGMFTPVFSPSAPTSPPPAPPAAPLPPTPVAAEPQPSTVFTKVVEPTQSPAPTVVVAPEVPVSAPKALAVSDASDDDFGDLEALLARLRDARTKIAQQIEENGERTLALDERQREIIEAARLLEDEAGDIDIELAAIRELNAALELKLSKLSA